MSKTVSHKISSMCVVFLFSFFTVSSFAQSGDLQNDLKRSLKKFDVVEFNAGELRSAESSRTLSLRSIERTFNLELVPRDLRAPNYRAMTSGENGLHTLEMPEVGIFKGKIAGEENSVVRLTISDGKLLGYFTSGGERFFVEPARNFSDKAAADKFVVYRENDMIEREDFECRSEVYAKLEEGKKYIGARDIFDFQTLRIIELATDADFEYVNALGGAGAANTEILSILNMIEGDYENELQLTFRVVFQHAWVTPDGFSPANTTTILQSFQSYWNANFTNIARDTAHLWSGKQSTAFQGLAYIGTVCRSPLSAYGMSGKIDFAPNKFVLSAHEIGHNFNATHVDAVQGCENTIMLANSTQFTQLKFCPVSRSEISGYVAANGSCLTEANVSSARFDFDGDDKADISVFRPSTGSWYIQKSSGTFTGVAFGQNGDKIVPADFDGDKITDIAVFRGGNWYYLNSSNNTFVSVTFGAATDIPIPADFDGDNKADINVYRPSNGAWYRLNSTNGIFFAIQFGAAEDKPIPADFDGDGKADINVYRPSNGGWYRINSINGLFFGTNFGAAEDKPLIGDFDGDGKADISVFRPSVGGWYVLQSTNNAFIGTIFGVATDIPAPADFDGDGKTDVSVFRPSNGTWYRINSGNSSFAAFSFGSNGDVPIPAFYIQ